MGKYCGDCIQSAIRHWYRNCESGCGCGDQDCDRGEEIAKKANNYDNLYIENKLLQISVFVLGSIIIWRLYNGSL